MVPGDGMVALYNGNKLHEKRNNTTTSNPTVKETDALKFRTKKQRSKSYISYWSVSPKIPEATEGGPTL